MRLSVVACCYYFALPAAVLVSQLLPFYSRDYVVTFTANAVNILLYLILTVMFREGGDYFKYSTMSDSELKGAKYN